MHLDEATGKLSTSPTWHKPAMLSTLRGPRDQKKGLRVGDRHRMTNNLPHSLSSRGLSSVWDGDPEAAESQADGNTTHQLPYLSSVLLSAAAAIGRTEAETLGATLGVTGVQRKCPQAALVTPRALHIFLEDKQSSTVSAAPC